MCYSIYMLHVQFGVSSDLSLHWCNLQKFGDMGGMGGDMAGMMGGMGGDMGDDLDDSDDEGNLIALKHVQIT